MIIEAPKETVRNLTADNLREHIEDNKGKPVVATIANVIPTSIIDRTTGEEIPKYAVYFGELDERLLLNKTNINALLALFGNDSNKWEGKKVTLYLDSVKMFDGKYVDGVRVKA